MLLGRKSQNTVLGLSSTFYWRSQFSHAPTISVNCFTISLSDYPTYQRWDRIVFMHFPTLLAKYTSVSTTDGSRVHCQLLCQVFFRSFVSCFYHLLHQDLPVWSFDLDSNCLVNQTFTSPWPRCLVPGWLLLLPPLSSTTPSWLFPHWVFFLENWGRSSWVLLEFKSFPLTTRSKLEKDPM
jgi:hypothetical protein